LINFPNVNTYKKKLGANFLSPGVTYGEALFAEAIATFIFITVILFTVEFKRKLASLAIGVTLAVGLSSIGAYDVGSMNPARSFGPAVIGGYWDYQWVFWVGPIVGSLIAAIAFLLMTLFLKREIKPIPQKTVAMEPTFEETVRHAAPGTAGMESSRL